MRKRIVIGNWKMNKTFNEGMLLAEEIINDERLKGADDVIKIIAPNFILLKSIAEKIKSNRGFAVSAQNCYHESEGAYTGEVSAKMVASSGASYVIIGHSERRLYFNETNAQLLQKTKLALKEQLTPVFCVGEKLEERKAGEHLNTIKSQLQESLFELPVSEFEKVIIAYEPVWAIGTGVTASTEQAQEMHFFIRTLIEKKYGSATAASIPLLYGGSCNTKNAKELFACKDVDGGLIGGASLSSNDFVQIIKAFNL